QGDGWPVNALARMERRNGMRARSMNRVYRAAISAAVLLLAAEVAHAQDADGVNCQDPVTQPEMTYCAHLDYEAADADLNAIWPDVVAAARLRDEDVADMAKERGVPTTLEALRVAQRAWIAWRDAQCEYESYDVFGGTAQPMVGSACLARLTHDRVEFFRSVLEGGQ
ncbi:lysozyme inhibitor LprI family protein, partial [Pseudanabaena sp. CCNP1317]|uniref:lysozyme inhibitor LprI family protein n=1 Tax=Pseudanabaena sp. CCNP1317 TaxID=3110253 RepID=UPI002B215CA3